MQLVIEEGWDSIEFDRDEVREVFKEAELSTPVIHQYLCDLDQLEDCDKILEL